MPGRSISAKTRSRKAQAKILAAGSLPLRWHLIGHLQSNKARKAAALFDVIHSIDSVRPAAERLTRRPRTKGRQVEVLIQVDLAGEPTKHGAPEAEVPAIIEAAHAVQSGATSRD